MKTTGLLLLLSFFSLLGFATPPPAAEVFQLTTKPIDPNTFALNWQIKPGFFLYKDRINLTTSPDSNVHIGLLNLPKALKKTDGQGKTYLIYREQLNVIVPVLGEQAGESLLTVHFQGCSDDGFCYPPETQVLKLTIDNNLALANVTMEDEGVLNSEANRIPSQNDKLATLFASHNWFIILLSFWGFGLLLSFTPCILPMIPVLSGIIVGHGPTLSTRKAFFLSLSYVLSMSITYAIIGAIVATLGQNLQLIMQSAWSISLFSLVFILLALSMFGFYELRLPMRWQTALASLTRRQDGGHYLSAALMGCLSILILSPCVTAPLIGALSYIAQTGNITLGSSSLFFLSLGMGTPLLMIGTSAGKLLPKAGRWMNTIKAFFGVLLLGMAIFLLERLLPSIVTMVAWAALLVFSGLYMGALTKAHTYQAKMAQGFGIMLLLYGLLILIGASQGHDNPIQPLKATSEAPFDTQTNTPQSITSMPALETALAHAKGKPVMLDFYADWCESCKTMAKTTLKTPQVHQALEPFVVLKIDVTANDKQSQQLLSHYQVVAPPTFLFLTREGEILEQLRLVGDIPPASFYETLQKALHLSN